MFMKDLFFPYKHVASEIFGEVKIPVVKLFLRNAKGEIGVDAIIDSGAVISVFPRSICDIIGTDFEEGEKVSIKTTTGEEIAIRVIIVNFKIADFTFKARVGFAEIEKIPYIVGRLDVFDELDILFEKEGVVLNRR